MKNLFIILALLVSSISLFSCTKDDSDLAEEAKVEEQAVGGEGDVFDDEDTW